MTRVLAGSYSFVACRRANEGDFRVEQGRRVSRLLHAPLHGLTPLCCQPAVPVGVPGDFQSHVLMFPIIGCGIGDRFLAMVCNAFVKFGPATMCLLLDFGLAHCRDRGINIIYSSILTDRRHLNIVGLLWGL